MVGDAVLVSEGAQTRSKRFLEIQKLRESKKEYDVPTAISLMKQMASAKFKESAEAHFRMNLDPKYNDQQLRATVSFLLFCRSVLFGCVLWRSLIWIPCWSW